MGEVTGIIRQYRDSHHRIAQMFAMGCTPAMIRRQTGVSMRRLSLLYADPTFRELIAGYSARAEAKLELAQDAYMDTAISNMLRAEQQIADHLDACEEEGELLPINILDKISQGRADRFGYSKHSTMKVEHDFATALDKAIARSEKAGQVKLIEGSVEVAGATPALGPPALDVEASHFSHANPAEEVSLEPARPNAKQLAIAAPATTQAVSLGGGGTGQCGETQRQSPRTFARVLSPTIKRRKLA